MTHPALWIHQSLRGRAKRTRVSWVAPLHGAAADAGMDDLTVQLASWLASQAENTGPKLVTTCVKIWYPEIHWIIIIIPI
jgi:hypothetical protein